MFELSVACKYLIPRRRQLSVSIISLISMAVIALVVWLIVVFFSVTDGLEKSWVQKLTALTAPVRITPTDAYYRSYYYQVDRLSDASDYASKTIGEKSLSPVTDPYDPQVDQELPLHIPPPDLDSEGNVKDLVKEVYRSIDEIRGVPGIAAKDFELTGTYIRLDLLRSDSFKRSQNQPGTSGQASLNYPAYLGSFESDHSEFARTLLPVTPQDLSNILSLPEKTNSDFPDDRTNAVAADSRDAFKKHLQDFFSSVTVTRLKTRSSGWVIPASLLPEKARWTAAVILRDGNPVKVIIPPNASERHPLLQSLEENGFTPVSGILTIRDKTLRLQLPGNEERILPGRFSIVLAGNFSFQASLDAPSVDRAERIDTLRFDVEIPVQGTTLKGNIPFRGLEIAEGEILPVQPASSPLWVHPSEEKPGAFILPRNNAFGEGVILPKSFRDTGVLLGDRGSLSYIAPTVSMVEEVQIPIYAAGFYDPGIIPIGGKFILANPEVTSLIRHSEQAESGSGLTAGINVRFDRIDDADTVKQNLQKLFKEKGIGRYWQVETYKEYEFTKGIIGELQSQKSLFMLIAVVIIVVACSNIISMLVILVNDKKIEIGILRSMGATSKNIALIFGFSGALIGIAGSLVGITAALLTLRYLDGLIGFLSFLQGDEIFKTTLYGQTLSGDLSMEALSFVLITTVILSLLAGLVPAFKACLLRPAQILRTGAG